MTPAEKLERAEQMGAKYQAGATLQEIGDYYNLSRERIRQIMTAELGITRKDGGMHHRVQVKVMANNERKELRCLQKHGMNLTQYRKLNPVGGDYWRSPIGKFRRQLQNARCREIEWNLTFSEWWTIWEQSGKWEKRGRGKGYCMSRYGDKGTYSVGNVRIISGSENNSEYIRRYWKEVRSGKRPPPKNHKRNTA